MNSIKRFAAVAAVLAAVFSTTASAAMQWTTGKYAPADWTPSANNIILGNPGIFSGTQYFEGTSSDSGRLTNGKVPTSFDKSEIYGIKSGDISWTFTNAQGVVEAKDVTEVKIFSRWGDGGRDGIAISKVEVKYDASDDAPWVDVGAPPVSYGVNNGSSGSALYATLSNGAAPFALSATAIRLTFGAQDNNGSGYVEFEVIGNEHSDDSFAVHSSIPASYGTPSPAYGAYNDMPKGATTLAMADPIYIKDGSGEVYSCTGWSYEDADGKVTHGDGTTAEIDYAGGICSFTWNWEVIGHTFAVSPISATLGTLSVTPPTYGDNGYADGSVVTVGVTPAGDNVFNCWVGDVPAGHETDNPLSITVGATGSIAPSFCWQYDSSARTIGDGDWVLSVSGDRESLTVAGHKSHAIGSVLDLGKPIVGGGAITAINQQIFNGATYIEELRLPSGITSIGTSAFQGCTKLRKVSPLFPASLKKIDLAAFSHAPIEGDMVLSNPELTTLVGHGTHGVFQDARFTSVDLGGTSISDIGQNVFYNNTAMTNLVLPSALKSVGQSAFDGCKALKSVKPFLPASVTSIGLAAFRYDPVEQDLVLSNPELTAIGSAYAFSGVQSKHIDLGASGIKRIGNHAFYGASRLESVKLPDALEVFEDSVFQECAKLTTIEPFLPPNVSVLGNGVFYKCGVNMPLVLSSTNLTTLPGNAYAPVFAGSAITSVDMRKSGITSIGVYVFRDCANLETAWMPGTLTSIGESAFSNCSKLDAVYWQDIATLSLHNYAFHINALTTRHFIPLESATWDAYLGASCNVQALTDTERTALLEKYPDTRRIVGKVKMPSGTINFQYLCRWSLQPGTLMLLR